MPRKAGIVDVAHAAGVTASTVSRVLNGDPTVRVRPDTRERILSAARAVDYRPNQAARALRHARVGAIALAVHDVSNPVYAPIIAGAQDAATSRDHVLLVADVAELARNHAFAHTIRSGLADGLLLLPAGDGSDQTVIRTVSRVLPTVIVNDAYGNSPSVGVDDRAAMRLITEHVIGLGHREIGLLAMDGDGRRAQDRSEAWQETLREHNIPVVADWQTVGGHTVESGRAAAEQILSRAKRPTAITAASALAAIGAIDAARARGITVPDELTVTGFHDLFLADYLDPPLTVVETPMRAIGEQSVDLLLRLLDGGAVEHRVIHEPAPVIIIRGSSAPPRRRTRSSRPRAALPRDSVER